MAESSLSLGYPDFMAEVGQFLGYGRASTGWTTAQNTEIDAIVQAGVRSFYYLSPESKGPAHEWSFLKPLITLPLIANTYTYALPDDFGGLFGDMTFASIDKGYQTVVVVGEEVIRGRQQNSTNLKGRPRYVAEQPLSSTGASGQRFQAIFWPTPDAVYTLTYRYKSLPAKLTAANPYPLGGMPHVETIMESCLAIAEQRMDDEIGLHSAKFSQRLAASILHDRRGMHPEYFGYNGDGSDGIDQDRFSRVTAVTFKGVQY